MNQLTGEEFIKKIKRKPSWCLSIKEPLEITTFVNLHSSPITHLSPLLHFKGKNKHGWVAELSHCKNLKEACGNFYGFANFSYSGIKKIKDIKVLDVDSQGWSAGFGGCETLKTLEGEFEGAILLDYSSIKAVKAIIKNGSTKKYNNYKKGAKLFLQGCTNIKAEKMYLNPEYQIDERLEGTIKAKIEEGEFE